MRLAMIWIPSEVYRILARIPFGLPLRWRLIVAAVLIFVGTGSVSLWLRTDRVTLVLIYTGDMKGHISHDYDAASSEDRRNPVIGGLAVIANIVDRYEREFGRDHVLVVDTGDSLFGSYESHLLTQDRSVITPDPDSLRLLRIMAIAGYDPIALGNMDLEYGADDLKQSVIRLNREGRDLDLRCCNLRDSRTGNVFLQPTTEYNVDGLSVRVIASISEMSKELVPERHLSGLTVVSEVEELWSILNDPFYHSDINFILTHSEQFYAIAKALARRQSPFKSEDSGLRRSVQRLNVVIAGNLIRPGRFEADAIGHSVLVAPPVYSGPAKHEGYDVGILKLVISRKNGRISLTGGTLERAKISSSLWDSNSEVARQIQTSLSHARELGSAGINCRILRPVDAFGRYGLVGPSPMGNLLTDAMREYVTTDFALLNCLAIRDGFPQGPLSIQKLWSALPFDDRLKKATLMGGDIAQIVARNALVPYSFLHLSGLEQHFIYADGSLSQSLLLPDGQEIQDDRFYSVCTTDFVYNGGDRISANGVTIRDLDASTEKSVANENQPLLRDVLAERLELWGEYDPDLQTRFLLGRGTENYLDVRSLQETGVRELSRDRVATGFSALFAALKMDDKNSITKTLIAVNLAKHAALLITEEMRSEEQRDEFLTILEGHFTERGTAIAPHSDTISRLLSILDSITSTIVRSSQFLDKPIAGHDFDLVMLQVRVLTRTQEHAKAGELLHLLESHSLHTSPFRRAELMIYQGIVAFMSADTKDDYVEARRLLVESIDHDDSLIPVRLAYLGQICDELGHDRDALNYYNVVHELGRIEEFGLEDDRFELGRRILKE